MSDSRRFKVVHTTTLAYSSPITASHNELRMTPLTEPGQVALEHRLRIRPMTWSNVFQDYWGAQVTAIDVSGGHERLQIESASTVERIAVPDEAGGLTWAELESEEVRDAHFEWLVVDGLTVLGEEPVALARAATKDLPVPQAVEEVFRMVADHLEYRPGATAVHSSAEDAWREGAGVCQDYTHVAVGLLRTMGVPARYVSGYLAPRQDSMIGDTSTGESHAWVEWWDGAWHGYDPTNSRPVGLDHVLVGRGRDYRDVPPLVGLFSGAAESTLEVDVTFTRLG